MTARPFRLGARTIGPGAPTFVIAELSGNHHQDFGLAQELVHAAKEAGADAVKLQTYTADTLTLDSDAPPFRIQGGTLWDGQTLHKLYQQAYTPWEWQPRLAELGRSLGMEVFSSPFDATAVAFLEDMGVPAYKIASFELVDLPLIRRVAATGKPLILSTGMATLDEIREAVEAAREAGATDLALLKCNSAYPAPLDEMNLRAMPLLGETFDAVVGLSDHTLGHLAATAAVAMGAAILEKHFILKRSAGGPDAAFSLEPEEFKALVQAVRDTERLLGVARFQRSPKEEGSLIFRRSLFVVADVKAGEPFTETNLRSIRPGSGLHTRHLGEVLGRTARRDIPRGTPLAWDLVV